MYHYYPKVTQRFRSDGRRQLVELEHAVDCVADRGNMSRPEARRHLLAGHVLAVGGAEFYLAPAHEREELAC